MPDSTTMNMSRDTRPPAMTTPVPPSLGQLSDALTALVEETAPLLCAVRTGPNRHVTGVLWRPDLVITCDQPLPAQERYTIVLPQAASLIPARPARRDPTVNLASLELDEPVARPTIRPPSEPLVGGLAVVLSADVDASPLARLAMIRRVGTSGLIGPTLTLDLPAGSTEPGIVVNAHGGLLGLLIPGNAGEALVVSHATIARFADPLTMVGANANPARLAAEGRPWLGVALQPTMLNDEARSVAGQNSGRLVVSLTPGGPAEQGGVRLGDTILAIDGKSLIGAHGLRSILGPEQIGTPVRLRLLRDGRLRGCNIMVAAHPSRQD